MLAYTFPSFNFYVNGFFSFLFLFLFPSLLRFYVILCRPLQVATYPLNRCQQYSSLAIFTASGFWLLVLVPRAKGPSTRRHCYRQLAPTHHRPFFSIFGWAVSGIRPLPEIFTWICASPFFLHSLTPPTFSHFSVYQEEKKEKRRTPKNTEQEGNTMCIWMSG
ncbi:AFH_G0016910.mRNA.1.CDS.1 [Saccharomyces cerevisiae]|nr:ALH_1c_G0017230.mRNA.1.CDS.1 [Saccharomyces cerevisiae]CAI4458329.1 ALH_1b_G0017250.mRNA.1.CDS.1 [Saccharomyces cerevisiae]CAI4459615.1 CEL_1a_G0017310.mRNA.1.CDS.1 [Saccharomyces cerevisiae]CAI4879385.1 AFH_G0016910.mRNA.1.CDS.1 [Saccharomyces cerevisiae]CAI5271926.1 CLL_HP2_G0014970.mRNA.1.CDS.1 [Saccharomyces cerevisiae]